MVVLTILDHYKRKEIDLLYSEAVDLLALLDDFEYELFCDLNPRFTLIISTNFRNTKDLREIVQIILNHIHCPIA